MELVFKSWVTPKLGRLIKPSWRRPWPLRISYSSSAGWFPKPETQESSLSLPIPLSSMETFSPYGLLILSPQNIFYSFISADPHCYCLC